MNEEIVFQLTVTNKRISSQFNPASVINEVIKVQSEAMDETGYPMSWEEAKSQFISSIMGGLFSLEEYLDNDRAEDDDYE